MPNPLGVSEREAVLAGPPDADFAGFADGAAAEGVADVFFTLRLVRLAKVCSLLLAGKHTTTGGPILPPRFMEACCQASNPHRHSGH